MRVIVAVNLVVVTIILCTVLSIYLQDSSKALSSTTNVLSILHELSPAHSAPPTKRTKLSTSEDSAHTSKPDCTKLDMLLDRIQQRLSATNREGW